MWALLASMPNLCHLRLPLEPTNVPTQHLPAFRKYGWAYSSNCEGRVWRLLKSWPLSLILGVLVLMKGPTSSWRHFQIFLFCVALSALGVREIFSPDKRGSGIETLIWAWFEVVPRILYATGQMLYRSNWLLSTGLISGIRAFDRIRTCVYRGSRFLYLDFQAPNLLKIISSYAWTSLDYNTLFTYDYCQCRLNWQYIDDLSLLNR
jgi:hypothetical protein